MSMRVILSTILGLTMFSPSLGNRKVMEIIYESRIKLAQEGVFDLSTERDSVIGQEQPCENEKVVIEGEEFACKNVDFLSFLSMKDLEMQEPAHDLGFGFGASSADIWGWLSPTGREFTVLAMDNGVVVVDGTDPVNPCIIAKMPTRRIVDQWGDVKVYKDALYHVKDTRINDDSPDAPDGNAIYGIEVYDLKQLDQLNCSVDGYIPMNLYPQYVSEAHGRSHNLAINPASGLLYSTGSEKCRGGLVILDVKTDPMRPVQVGCASQDGYTHDVQCLTYDGPDIRFNDTEICFAYNEDTLTIWDISNPALPEVISKTYYPNQVYSHQGWINDELTKVLLDDELDELCNEREDAHERCDDFVTTELSGEQRTTTNVFDITDLTNPVFEGTYTHPDLAVDHNLYVWGSVHKRGHGGNPAMDNPPVIHYAYMHNYLAGLKIVDIRSDDIRDWFEAGYFDIAPGLEGNDFAGAWSGYMHPSGSYAISSIERGLFFVRPAMAFTDLGVIAPGANDNQPDRNPVLIFFAIVMVGLLLTMLVFTAYKQRLSAPAPNGSVAASSGQVVSKARSRKPQSSTANPMHEVEPSEKAV